jgi:AcrR family transcriptional regulator
MAQETDIRRMIIERTGELFFKFGFASTTTQQIAEDLEISKKTLYKFFPSKEALLESIMEWEHYLMDLDFQKLMKNPELDVFHKLMGIAEAAVVSNAKYSPQFLKDFDKCRACSPEKHAEMHQVFFDHVETLLKEGVAEGTFRKDLNPKYIIFIINCMQGNLTFETLTRMGSTLSEAIMGITDLLCHGFLTEEARKKYLKDK